MKKLIKILLMFFCFFISLLVFSQGKTIESYIEKNNQQKIHHFLSQALINLKSFNSSDKNSSDLYTYKRQNKRLAQSIELDTANNTVTVGILLQSKLSISEKNRLFIDLKLIYSGIYKYYTATIKLADLEDIAELESIRYIEPSFKTHSLLDQSILDINANNVWSGNIESTPINYLINGENTYIGIIDTKPNISHLTFLNNDGQSRFQNTDDIENYTYDLWNDPGHGSHVAGIAGGTGFYNNETESWSKRGVAYKSKLLWYPSGTSNGEMNALVYMKSFVANDPLIINNSNGIFYGPRDGSLMVERLLDSLINGNLVYVNAAGNQSTRFSDPIFLTGRYNLHKFGQIGSEISSFTEVEVKVNSAFLWNLENNEINIEIWHDNDIDVEIVTNDIINPLTSGRIVSGSWDHFYINDHDYINIHNSNTNYHISQNNSNNSNSKVLFISFDAHDDKFPWGTYTIRLYPHSSAESGPFHAYICEKGIKKGGFINGDDYHTVVSPGIIEKIISVSSSRKSTEDDGDIAGSSSLGPIRTDNQDQVSKPDITAPGDGIFSADYTTTDDWIEKSGTSMAAPHVTGAIALLMQHFKQLNAIQIKDILQKSAGPIPSGHWQGNGTLEPEDRKYWGAGKLDILAAYQSMVGFDYDTLEASIVNKMKIAFSTHGKGLPIEPVVSNWNNEGYYKQKLTNGAIFLNNTVDFACYIGEGIWNKWLEIDNIAGILGMPTTSEFDDPHNNDFPTVYFEHGKIYWNGNEAIVCTIEPNLYAYTTEGSAPLTVIFADASISSNFDITAWLWDFGDGNTSDEQYPVHTYQTVGSFTVSLTLFHYDHSFTATRQNYITTFSSGIGTLSGVVFHDLNLNGIQDNNEPQVGENWVVILDGPVQSSINLSENGSFSFHDIPVGSYTVRIEPHSDWTIVYPFWPSSREIFIENNSLNDSVDIAAFKLQRNNSEIEFLQFPNGQRTGINNTTPMSPQAPNQSSPINPVSLPPATIHLSISSNGWTPEIFYVKKDFIVQLAISSIDQWTHVFVFNHDSLTSIAVGVSPNETRMITFKTYGLNIGDTITFLCDVPGHAARGEIGKMIIVDDIQPSIEITYPNSNEVLYKGIEYLVQWSSQNVSGNFQIDLYKGDENVLQLAASTPNTGIFTFIPTDELIDGFDFRIGISAENGSVSTFSSFFGIINNPAEQGQPCPDQPSITDIDGNVYNTILINNKCWLKENLRTTRYRDGIPIEYVEDNTDWSTNIAGAYSWYDNDQSWKEKYGALYNWHAINNPSAICPQGWHVPSDSEWYLLNATGTQLKSCRQIGSPYGETCNTNEHPRWEASDSNHGTNETGFSGLPGGNRDQYGIFQNLGNVGFYWSSTLSENNIPYLRYLLYWSANFSRSQTEKQIGYSVRCIKDDEVLPSIELIDPIEGATINSDTIRFEWIIAPELTSYLLYVDNNSGFGSPEIAPVHITELQNLQENTFTISGNWLSENVYYWKVLAITDGDTISSEVRTFTYQPEKAETPQWVPLYRAYLPTDVDHFYCSSESHLQTAINENYQFEGVEGFVSLNPFETASPGDLSNIFRFYIPDNTTPRTRGHYYTTSEADKDNRIIQGWIYEGITGYAYSQPGDGLVPLYHNWLNVPNDRNNNFYTTSEYEKNNAISQFGYLYQGITCYVSANGGLNEQIWQNALSAVGYGVNPVNGNLGHYEKDVFHIAEGKTTLNYKHLYNSNAVRLFSSVKPLGNGWNHAYNASLITTENNVMIVWPDHIDLYNKSWLEAITPGLYDMLQQPNAEEYTITKKNQSVFRFSKILTSPLQNTYMLTSITDRFGNAVSLHYNDLGRLEYIKSPANRFIKFEYYPDDNETLSGLIKSVKDSLALNRTVHYQYDNQRNLIHFTDALELITSYTYDSISPQDHFLATVEYPDGTAIKNTYDPESKRIIEQDIISNERNNYKTIIGLPDNNHVDVVDAIGNQTGFSFNDLGNITSLITASGSASFYFEDSNNPLKPTKVTDGMGYTTEINYDSNGNPIAVNKPLGVSHHYEWNSTNDLLKYTNPLGVETQYTYQNGKLTSVINPRGTIGFTHFGNGNIQSVTDALGQTTSFTYDAWNNLTQITDNIGNSSNYEYDNAGKMTHSTDANGALTIFSHNLNDLLTSVTDALGYVTQYDYDQKDRLIAVTDARNNSTSTSYNDVTGWIDQTTDQLGNHSLFDYFDNGLLQSVTTRNGQTLHHEYDSSNRLVSTSGAGLNRTFVYDNNDRLEQLNDQHGAITYVYDSLNRLVSYTDFYNNLVQYEYDKADNVTKITYPGNKVVDYTYYDDNLLHTVSDWLGNISAYTYRDDGSLQRVDLPNGTYTTYAYDDASRMTGLTNRKSDNSIISEYTFTLDAIGNHTDVAQQEPMAMPVLDEAEINYSYDNANRILTAGAITYGHDLNGNLTSANNEGVVATFSYDVEDRLLAISGSKDASYIYDGLGNRRSSSKDGVNIRYILDINSQLEKVVVETDAANNALYYYIHGDGLLYRINAADNSIQNYHYDYRGSTIAITDAEQNITHQYVYDEFGKVMDLLETDYNPYRFVGKYGVMHEFDDIFFMRARYYNPEIGRFLGEDPLWFTNLYHYTENNPISQIDPKGENASELFKSLLRETIKEAPKYVLKEINVNNLLTSGLSISKGLVVGFLEDKLLKLYFPGDYADLPFILGFIPGGAAKYANAPEYYYDIPMPKDVKNEDIIHYHLPFNK